MRRLKYREAQVRLPDATRVGDGRIATDDATPALLSGVDGDLSDDRRVDPGERHPVPAGTETTAADTLYLQGSPGSPGCSGGPGRGSFGVGQRADSTASVCPPIAKMRFPLVTAAPSR